MSQSKMSTVDGEKKFVMQKVFNNVMSLQKDRYHYGQTETHFDIPWRIRIYVKDDRLWLGLKCDKFHGLEEWSISTNILMTITKQLGEKDTFSLERIFDQKYLSNYSMKRFSIQEAKNYIVDGDLTVKFEVRIKKMEGIKEKLRNFDQKSTGKFSDVVLVIGGQKFYVIKNFLAMHSTYFESMFFGGFAEFQKPEIELKDIDPVDFQNFLELINGESFVNDYTVEKILHLADFFGAKTAISRCQDFLLKNTKLSLKRKFDAAIKADFDDVKKQCLSEMKTKEDVKNVLPEDPAHFLPTVWAELLETTFSLF